MDFGYIRRLGLHVVVIAEGHIGVGTPDILLKSGIVDKGVTVLLNTVDGLVAFDLLFADGILLRPTEEHLQSPLLEEGEYSAVEHRLVAFVPVFRAAVLSTTALIRLIAGGHVEIDTG